MSRARPSRPALALILLFVGVAVIQLTARAIHGVSLHDQADLVLFAQDWRAAYDEQVPVYAWIVSALMRATGWAVWTPDVLKLAFLGLALAGLYQAGRALGGPLAGTTAALTLFLLPTVHDDVLREATHSAGVLAFAAVSLACLVPAERPRRPWGLALAWAGGLLAKHNMALVIASQLSAFARLASRRLVLAAALAVVLAAPAYLVLAANLDTVRAGTAEFVAEGGGGGRWRGLADLAGSVLAEGALLLIFLGAAYWRLRARGGHATPDERRLLLTLPAALALYAVVVVLFDVGTVRDRWLAPSLLALCPIGSAWLSRGTGPRAQRLTPAILGALLLILAGYRATQALFSDGTGQGAMQARPYPAVADWLASSAADADAVLFADDQLAATTKTRHPHLAIFGARTRDRIPEGPARLLLVGAPPGAPIGRDRDWTAELAKSLDCGPLAEARFAYRYANASFYDVRVRTCTVPAP